MRAKKETSKSSQRIQNSFLITGKSIEQAIMKITKGEKQITLHDQNIYGFYAFLSNTNKDRFAHYFPNKISASRAITGGADKTCNF